MLISLSHIQPLPRLCKGCFKNFSGNVSAVLNTPRALLFTSQNSKDPRCPFFSVDLPAFLKIVRLNVLGQHHLKHKSCLCSPFPRQRRLPHLLRKKEGSTFRSQRKFVVLRITEGTFQYFSHQIKEMEKQTNTSLIGGYMCIIKCSLITYLCFVLANIHMKKK